MVPIRDMNFHTFERSAEALEPYFCQMAAYAWKHGETPEKAFEGIREIGKQAEKAMFTVTQGVNTHKGLIFSLGILCSGAAILLGRPAYSGDGGWSVCPWNRKW